MCPSDAPFKSFAVVGAGPHIGIRIVKAFLATNTPVLVIARPSSNVSALPVDDQNLKVVRADYMSAVGITRVLQEHKIDVLISAVNLVSGGAAAQHVLADAAKAAGVKLFVPSEFGTMVQSEEGPAGAKLQFAKYLKSIGLPSLRIYNGLFLEFIPWVSCVEETGIFYIVGEGNAPISFVAVNDVAGYLVHVLTTHGPSRLFDTELRIEGQRATFTELGAMYKGKAPVVHVDAIPTEGISDSPVRQYLYQNFNQGAGSNGYNAATGTDDESLAKSGNSLWEGHRWLTIQEVLGL
ncbi:NAD(P)-binding protein [Gyrodon lividus]|nr:NAD(P)-binding protein [Gyrodon lividus]